MKKKNNNSLLMTILGGAIFCFVFLGLAFVFTNNTKIMKGNNISNDEEILLGDTCTEWDFSWLPTNDYFTCGYPYGVTSLPNADSSSYTVGETVSVVNTVDPTNCGSCSSSPCLHVETYKKEGDCTKYSGCDSGKYLDADYMCQSCPSGYSNSSGIGRNNTTCYANVEAGYSYPNGPSTKTACGYGYYSDNTKLYFHQPIECLPCGTGKTTATTTATSPSQCVDIPTTITASVICYDVTYDGTEKTIAECSHCKFYSAPSGTSISSDQTKITATEEGSYSVGASADYGAKFDNNDTAKGCTGRVLPQSTNPSSGECTIKAENVSGYQHMSPGEKETVKFTVSAGCQSEVTVTTENFDGPSTVQGNTNVDYTARTQCRNGRIWGKVKSLDGTKTIQSNIISIYIAKPWSGPTNVKTTERTPASGSAANKAGTDVYYINCNDTTGTCDKYVRGCGTSGGSSGTTEKCYIDDNNVYHWTSSPESSWKTVSKTKSECENVDACFEKPDGTRAWGKYYDQIVNGYKLVTSIGDKTTCETKAETDACYVKTDDATEYKWSSTAIDGYTKTEITDPKECQPLLCYTPVEGELAPVMGKYKDDGKYTLFLDEDGKSITDASKCKVPATDACYKDKVTGKYAWGEYSSNGNYELVTTITSSTACTNEVPVPATGINLSKLVYIFMAILMACGVGFIYYSSVVKKNS